jgi:hypothetical protein
MCFIEMFSIHTVRRGAKLHQLRLPRAALRYAALRCDVFFLLEAVLSCDGLRDCGIPGFLKLYLLLSQPTLAI